MKILEKEELRQILEFSFSIYAGRCRSYCGRFGKYLILSEIQLPSEYILNLWIFRLLGLCLGPKLHKFMSIVV